MAVKPAEPSTARVVPVVAAAAAEVVGRGEAVGSGLAVVAAAAAIYRLVYSYGSLYGANAYQHAYLLGPKSYAQAARPKTAAARTRSGGRARTWWRQRQ